MTALGRVEAWVRERATPWIWVAWPGLLVHELTHAVVARAHGARATVDWERGHVRIAWPPNTERAHLRRALLGPLYLGSLLGAPLVGAALVAVQPDSTPEVVGGVWLVLNWGLYTLPSLQDLRAVRG